MWSTEPTVLADPFRERGRAVLDGALDARVADAVRQSVEQARPQFRLVVRNGVHPRTMSFDSPLSATKEEVLRAQLAIARERGLFTYVYRLWTIPDDDPTNPASRLQRFLGSDECWTWIEEATGVRPVDCQVAGVTQYRTGDYLGAHSDRLVKFGRRRRVAFVLYLSRGWTAGAGGELVLLGADGSSEPIAPMWNRLVLLDVDRVHEHYGAAVLNSGFEKLALPGFFCA